MFSHCFRLHGWWTFLTISELNFFSFPFHIQQVPAGVRANNTLSVHTESNFLHVNKSGISIWWLEGNFMTLNKAHVLHRLHEDACAPPSLTLTGQWSKHRFTPGRGIWSSLTACSLESMWSSLQPWSPTWAQTSFSLSSPRRMLRSGKHWLIMSSNGVSFKTKDCSFEYLTYDWQDYWYYFKQL